MSTRGAFIAAAVAGLFTTGAPMLASAKENAKVHCAGVNACKGKGGCKGADNSGGNSDPTLHDTFRAAANRDARGQGLWSDLSFTELDAALPLGKRHTAIREITSTGTE